MPARLLYFVWVALRTRPDVVGGFHLLVNGLVAVPLARLVGGRSLYFCVGGPVELLDGGIWGENRIFARLGTPDAFVEQELIRAVGGCDVVITMGTRAIEFFRGCGLRNPFYGVSGGIDDARFRAVRVTPKYDVVITCRLVPIKRVDLFLRTVRELSFSLPNVRALIVGDGPLRKNLENLAAELGIAEAVTFAGQQDNVEDWLRQARVFVLTSDSEGLSLALMEAMMSGLPAVVSQVGDLADLVADGINGYLVSERTPEAFAQPLLALLRDPERLRACSEAAATAARRHTPGAVTESWTRILGEIGRNDDAEPKSRSSALSRKNMWESAPAILKRALSPVLAHVPPASLLGRDFRRTLQFVNDAQWWPADRSRDYQLARLRRLFVHAATRTRYYNELFKTLGFDPRDLNTLEDIASLPLLEREQLRDRLPDLTARPLPLQGVDYVSTGGSTGGPLWFHINTERSSIDYAHLVAGWSRVGYRVGTPLAVLRGRVVPADAHGLHHGYDPLLRHHYYSSFHLNTDNLSRYLQHIRSLGPCYIHAYPSSIGALARYMRSSGEPPLNNVKGILVESEPVFDDERQRVQLTLQCPYFASYGLTEKVAAAAGCEHSTAYHVWPTYGYVELIDENGNTINTPGARGEIVGTGFINTAVPFIRYRTGDFATYLGKRCPQCGREQLLLTDISGRRPQEWLVGSDGTLIAWTALNMHDDTFRNVLRFQFEQQIPGRALLKVVPSSQFTEADAQRIVRNLHLKLDGAVSLEIALVDQIRLTEAGKAIYVDQRLPIPT